MNGIDTNSDPSCGTHLANRLCWALVVVTITERDKSNNGKGAPIEVEAIRRVNIPEKLRVETTAPAGVNHSWRVSSGNGSLEFRLWESER